MRRRAPQANGARSLRVRVRIDVLDKLEHIFEPFVQLDRGQTAGVVGTGLGLAISRDLARAMGADLTAESTLDTGSTFTLSLPRRGIDAQRGQSTS